MQATIAISLSLCLSPLSRSSLSLPRSSRSFVVRHAPPHHHADRGPRRRLCRWPPVALCRRNRRRCCRAPHHDPAQRLPRCHRAGLCCDSWLFVGRSSSLSGSFLFVLFWGKRRRRAGLGRLRKHSLTPDVHPHLLPALCVWFASTAQTPHPTATIGVHVDAGSRFETAENNGFVLPHLLACPCVIASLSRSFSRVCVRAHSLASLLLVVVLLLVVLLVQDCSLP